MLTHLYGLGILVVGCGSLVAFILYLEWIMTHADIKLKNLKTMKEKKYTEADLVSFGNFLLSEERNASIEDEKMRNVVGDWDIANWDKSKEWHNAADRTYKNR